jgi:hypothetical protein
MTVRKYTSRSQQTTLTSAVTSGGTSITVASATTLLATVGSGEFINGATFTVVIDPDTALEEIVDITAASSNTFTITRSVDAIGTAQDHSAGAVVRHMIIGRDLREPNTHIEASSSVHGLTSTSGVVVGTAATQTLTNKTLTTPIVAGATLSGTITSTATISGGTLTGAIVTGLTSSGLADTQATPKNYVDAILVLQTASQTAAATSAASAATSASSAAASATAATTSATSAATSATSAAASATTAANSVAAIQTSATSAATSASSAATSASSAATSASSAATSRTSSFTSQTAAATSASSAATSASSAATSATSAATSATAAATSATSAAASATTAANSVAAIQTSATSAANSASAAATSAASAATSASSAAASTSAAATSAASAATSATSAAASASAASTSATSAAVSASAASTSATSAAASQSAASTSASSAATSATSSANSATTATTQAAAASTSATSASVSATAAATSASSAATSAASAAASATAAAGYVVPSQTGNAGKVLGTNGTAASWTAGSYSVYQGFVNIGSTSTASVAIPAGDYLYETPAAIPTSFTLNSQTKSDSWGKITVSASSTTIGIVSAGGYINPESPFPYRFSQVAYNGTKYLALVDSSGYVYESSDLTTWSYITNPGNWYNTASLAYGNGIFCGIWGGSNGVKYSTDQGSSWTTVYGDIGGSMANSISPGRRRMIFDGTNFVILSVENGKLFWSSDCISWSSTSSAIVNGYDTKSGISYANGKYFVWDGDNGRMKSGTSKTNIGATAPVYVNNTPATGTYSSPVYYSNSLYWYAGMSNNNSNCYIYSSPDGITWTTLTVKTFADGYAAYYPPIFVVDGNSMILQSGSASEDGTMYVSTNAGSTWSVNPDVTSYGLYWMEKVNTTWVGQVGGNYYPAILSSSLAPVGKATYVKLTPTSTAS